MKDWIATIVAENMLGNAIGTSSESILNIEKNLGVRFSKEYKEFLSSIGVCMFNGHEIVGISQYSGLDVLSTTNEARELNPDVPANFYVIENAHFDGIYIWQDETGAVYQTYPNCQPKKIADSLYEYLVKSNR
ncbi:MAG: SMI1/KNR4 family protein [Clostridiales bacterium]|nr:SMI1/KNR4 family protein [Clostridiales bacterium]